MKVVVCDMINEEYFKFSYEFSITKTFNYEFIFKYFDYKICYRSSMNVFYVDVKYEANKITEIFEDYFKNNGLFSYFKLDTDKLSKDIEEILKLEFRKHNINYERLF